MICRVLLTITPKKPQEKQCVHLMWFTADCEISHRFNRSVIQSVLLTPPNTEDGAPLCSDGSAFSLRHSFPWQKPTQHHDRGPWIRRTDSTLGCLWLKLIISHWNIHRRLEDLIKIPARGLMGHPAEALQWNSSNPSTALYRQQHYNSP